VAAADVKPGNVVYLAGEGHHGMKGRIAAWKQHHAKKGLGMWVSKAGCDLNTPEGLQRVRESIRSLGEKVDVIVVDTLHRFLAGDENSAQDAKTMLDTCAELMKEFHCTVILVHHTGVSDEAQHRARGSSAWRGALDIEISVVPPRREGDSISIVQRKSKDAEIADPVFVDLEPVTIADWKDDDQQPVKSAVLVGGAKPTKPEKSAIIKAKSQIQEAWRRSQNETHDGKPYVSRQAIINYLTTVTDGEDRKILTEAAARKAIAPGDKGRMVGALLADGAIDKVKDGYVIVDKELSSQMMIGMGQ
jgi:KaiC/GvpD/RAD55 family RecA-like ATPase